MKISSFVLMILFVGFLFTSWNILVEDFETSYVNSTIIETEDLNDTYLETYDASNSINDSFLEIQEGLSSIRENEGWFSGLAGGVVVAVAFIKLPLVVLNATSSALGNFLSIGMLVGIPSSLLGIVAIMVTIFIIFKLLSATRRYEA